MKIFLLALFFLSSSAVALTPIVSGSKISSTLINSNISEINTLLQGKGFSLRFSPVTPGTPVSIVDLNSNFNRINTLRLYDAPLSEIAASSGEVINPTALNNKFSELKDAIAPLFCETKQDASSNLYNAGVRTLYTFSSDYINPGSYVSVYLSRGWPGVTNFGSLVVYNNLGQSVWTQNYDLGTHSNQSASATYNIPSQYFRKGYSVRLTHNSNNGSTAHSSATVTVNVAYACP